MLRSTIGRRSFSTTAPTPVLRVVVAGGGIAGCILASQLAKEPGIRVQVIEKRRKDALPPGLNLLLNHNGMSAIHDVDPSLAKAVRGRGHDIVGWSARMMTGRSLYEIPSATAAGLADGDGVRARWDEVNAVVQQACWEHIEWGDAVQRYEYTSSGNGGNVSVKAILGARDIECDLLIGSDGRYSAVREHMEGGELPPPRFGPPAISDFRIVAPEHELPSSLNPSLIEDMLRVYNTPDASLIQPGGKYHHLVKGIDDEGFGASCMAGLARCGVMRIRPPPTTGS